MARLYVLLFVVQIALAVIALISCLSADDDEIRALPRLVWVLIILFFPLIGSIAWFLAGRPARTTPRSGWRTGGGFPEHERRRPVAPDDDPDFLRSLDASADPERSKQDREMFEKWEDDLRRREDELRRKNDGDDPA
jgi:Phospholipase_D-nuclease N-terminal